MSVYTVSQINSYIQRMLTEDYLLRRLTVRGEVSGCKYHTSGHIYFNLKDESDVIACIMYRQYAEALKKRFRIEDGVQLLVTGQIRVFGRAGRYQLYAEEVRPDGQGTLYERFEKLKQRLLESGMFDASYKQPIPKYIRTLGVVTAKTGAAIHDIIRTARRRDPGIRIILYPAIVQGDQAADSIVKGIRTLAEQGVDCMIVGRGGGSPEDLWAFNEERVAEAIFNCPVPIISAVGHEVDFTIADFVADLRAATPTAAAELAVYEKKRLTELLEDEEIHMTELMEQRLKDTQRRLRSLRRILPLLSPTAYVKEERKRLTDSRGELRTEMERRLCDMRSRLSLSGPQELGFSMQAILLENRQRLEQSGPEKLTDLMQTLMIGNRTQLNHAIDLMEANSPLRRLKSGYAHVTDGEGRTVRSVLGVSAGDALTVTLADGALKALVEEVIAAAVSYSG